MSKTRNFKMGHADVFQDKPNEESRKFIKSLEKDIEKCGLLVRHNAQKLAEALSDKSEAELSIVLKFLVKETNNLKSQNITD